MRGSWRPNRTATYWPPFYWPKQRFFPVLQAAQTEALGPSLSGTCSSIQYLLSNSSDPQLSIGGLRASSAGCWLSLPHLITNWSLSKLSDFLSSRSYIKVLCPLLLVGVTIAPNQPIHGQGYNSDIRRLDAHVLYIGAFPILTARPGRRSTYNTSIEMSGIKTIYFRHSG